MQPDAKPSDRVLASLGKPRCYSTSVTSCCAGQCIRQENDRKYHASNCFDETLAMLNRLPVL